MRTVRTRVQLRAAVDTARSAGGVVALVPTMGALHDGHLALVRRAAQLADTVVVSVFVNPTQFDRADDLQTYPRDLAGDERRLRALGADAPAIVYAPSVAEMYPGGGARTTVHVAGLTDGLCGAHRPGHFDGVATVVTKLLAQVRPDVAVFGRKDRQQLAVVECLVGDLDLDVRIVGVPTVRERDGLALSSRNARLSPDGRRSAVAISRALATAVRSARAARAAGRGIVVADVGARVRTTLEDTDGIDVEYVEVVDPSTFTQPAGPPGPGDRIVVAVAVEADGVRLIDNVELGVDEDEDRLLEAVGAGQPTQGGA